MKRRHWILLLAGATTIGAAGYFAGRAKAGVPSVTPLFYAALLEDTNGLVSGSKSIVLRIYDDAAAGQQVCNPSPSGATNVVNGRFRFALDATCVTAVHNNAELWAELTVDGQTLPRTKIGAVPYALEAGNVPWAGVGGIVASTEWPGTVPLSRLTGNVFSNGGKTYSHNAKYCGKTAAITVGTTVTSYLTAKGLCETACSSASAHVCTGEELVRFASTGGSTSGSGWYNSGSYGIDPNVSNAQIHDCGGWSQATAAHLGHVWGGSPTDVTCNNTTVPFLCCD